MKNLNFLDLLVVFIRSLFIQTLWNYENMQGTGITFAIQPIISKLYRRKPKKKREILVEYLEFFNTNPYLAPGIIGLLIHKERMIIKEKTDRSGIDKIKLNYMGPIAALGDNIIWAKINTFFIILSSAVFVFLYIQRAAPLTLLAAPAIYLVGYNLFTSYFRFIFYVNGLKGEEHFIRFLQTFQHRIQWLDNVFNISSLFLIGLLIMLLFYPVIAGTGIKDKILLNIIGILIILYNAGIYIMVRDNLKRRYVILYILSMISMIFLIR